MNYEKFLKNKSWSFSGVGIDPGPIHEKLFDFQKDIVRFALRKGRAAIFADCGLGKTFMQLEWARQVSQNGPVLILAPLTVSVQTANEAKAIGLHINICESQSEVKPGINITNYEKLHKFDASVFAGVVLDESSILKSFTGKIRTSIINSFSKTKFKLACTATPSPNDFMELGITQSFWES